MLPKFREKFREANLETRGDLTLSQHHIINCVVFVVVIIIIIAAGRVQPKNDWLLSVKFDMIELK